MQLPICVPKYVHKHTHRNSVNFYTSHHMALCFRQTPFVCSPRYVFPNMYAEPGMFTIFLDSNNVCSCARVDQPTSFRHSQRSVQGLKKTIGDAVTKHVTVGQASSVNQLKVMSAAPTELRLLQVERASGMGFNISNHTARGKKTTLAVFEQKLTTEFLNWGQYMSLHIMGAVAEAINQIIVVWVAHPQYKTALIVHHLHSMQGGGLAIHAPLHAKGVIHLRFFNSANELDSDVFKWGAGNAGHFELLCEPVNGWPKGKADTLTPRRGPQNQKRGAKGSPDATLPEGLLPGLVGGPGMNTVAPG